MMSLPIHQKLRHLYALIALMIARLILCSIVLQKPLSGANGSKLKRLALKIKEIVEHHESNFAYPSQSIYIENLPDNNIAEKAEAFIAEEKKT